MYWNRCVRRSSQVKPALITNDSDNMLYGSKKQIYFRVSNTELDWKYLARQSVNDRPVISISI